MNICRIFVRNFSDGKKVEALKKIGIIGVPFEKGQPRYGVSVAPAALRDKGLIKELQEIPNLDIKDYGDIVISSQEENHKKNNVDALTMVSVCNKHVSKQVSEVLNAGRIAVTIGGDHSIGVGTVDGHYNVNKDMILIWVAAHADLNTSYTTDSGSPHGMSVALLVKEFAQYWPQLPNWEWQELKFSIKSLGYIGLRSVGRYERLAIEKYEVPCYAMDDIEEYGIKKSVSDILTNLDPTNSRPIHVSFDIAALDAIEAPSTGTPVRGGLTLREAIQLMEIIHATGCLRAIDMVEINPAIGEASHTRQTIEAGIAILKAGLGFSRKGTAPANVHDFPVQDSPKANKKLHIV